MLGRLKIWPAIVKRDVYALYLARRDPRVPWYAKGLALATVAYALSPIDLIPDLIPVLGYLDELVILPAAILVTVRLVPAPVMAELRAEATKRLTERPPRSRAGAVAIVGGWLACAAGLGWLLLGE